ncbi:hypothetical protein Tco_0963856 [Tanacetum coccineum]
MEPNKALIKDEEADSVDVHLYRSMIGSLMYLTASRPDIMFDVCACLAQFLGKRLSSWQCKKQTIVANSTTKAEYVAAANCYGQVLWIQNQMLDYGFNFMNTKIFIDNESTICIVKNLVFHSKTKHIDIRHHFIRDCYEKKLIQVIKIHTDHNVVDLLTKAFDVSRSERVLEKPNEPPLLEGHTFGSGEGSMEHTFELMDNVPPTPHDLPLSGGYTPGSDEGRLKLKELMAILKSQEIRKKEEVKHLTPNKEDIQADSDFDVLDDDMEDVEGETVHTTTIGVSAVSAPVTTTGVAISTAQPRTPPTTAATAFIDEDLTIAQTLIKMKEEKVKEKGVAIKDVEDSPKPIRSINTLQLLPSLCNNLR